MFFLTAARFSDRTPTPLSTSTMRGNAPALAPCLSPAAWNRSRAWKPRRVVRRYRASRLPAGTRRHRDRSGRETRLSRTGRQEQVQAGKTVKSLDAYAEADAGLEELS